MLCFRYVRLKAGGNHISGIEGIAVGEALGVRKLACASFMEAHLSTIIDINQSFKAAACCRTQWRLGAKPKNMQH